MNFIDRLLLFSMLDAVAVATLATTAVLARREFASVSRKVLLQRDLPPSTRTPYPAP